MPSPRTPAERTAPVIGSLVWLQLVGGHLDLSPHHVQVAHRRTGDFCDEHACHWTNKDLSEKIVGRVTKCH